MLEAFLQALPTDCQPVQALKAHFESFFLPCSVLRDRFFLESFLHVFHSENTSWFLCNSWSSYCSLFLLPPYPLILFCQCLIVSCSFCLPTFSPHSQYSRDPYSFWGITWHIFVLLTTLLSWVGSLSSLMDFKLQRTPAFQFILLVSWSRGRVGRSFLCHWGEERWPGVPRSGTHCLICLSLCNAEHAIYFPSVFWTHMHPSTLCSVGNGPVGGRGKKKEAVALASLNVVVSGLWWFSAPGKTLFRRLQP